MTAQKKTVPFVSACLIARDEARFISRAIRSLKGLADEIWVGDTGSEDDTVRLAREAGAHVFEFPWPNDFSVARNRVLERARGRWIFVLDADEWFEDGEARRLRRDLAVWDRNPQVVGFSIYQANLLSLTSPDVMDKSRTVRGFRNRPQHRYVNAIHEQIVGQLHGGIVESPYEVTHAGFVREIAETKSKGDRNLTLLNAMLEEMPEDNPHRVYLWLQHGRELQRAGRLSEAADDYMRAAEGLLLQTPCRTGFNAILFGYLAETLHKLGRYPEILQWAERMADRIPLTQAEWPFFQGMAHYAMGQWAEAAGRFLQTMACLEGAPLAQEFVSFDRTVLTYSGAVQSLAAVGRLPEAWRLLRTAFAEFPDRVALAEAFCTLAALVTPQDRTNMIQSAPLEALSGVAHVALQRAQRDMLLEVSEWARRQGSVDTLPWVAALALQEQRADLAGVLLDELPAAHPSRPLINRLQAMRAWQLGDWETFEALVALEEPVYRAGLKAWAGVEPDEGERSLAHVGLEALSRTFPVPPALLTVSPHVH